MKRIVLLVLFLTTCASRSVCEAQSPWDRRDNSRVFLFTDTRARHVGDLLTIVVRESTDVTNKDERAADKSTEIGGVFNFSGATVGNGAGGSASASLDSKTTTDRRFDGTSEYKVDREFSDRITVAILDVLPNGNLVVAGKRHQRVAGEVRTLVVTGIVRPYDVTRDNTVLSQFVGNLEMKYEGDGPESSFSNQGWLGRITNKLWPF